MGLVRQRSPSIVVPARCREVDLWPNLQWVYQRQDECHWDSITPEPMISKRDIRSRLKRSIATFISTPRNSIGLCWNGYSSATLRVPWIWCHTRFPRHNDPVYVSLYPAGWDIGPIHRGDQSVCARVLDLSAAHYDSSTLKDYGESQCDGFYPNGWGAQRYL